MKKIILTCLLLFSITLIIACNQTNEKINSQIDVIDYDVIFNEGLDLLDSKEFKLAIEKFEMKLEHSSDEPTLLNLSKAHYALEEYEKAKEYVTNSVENVTIDTSEEHRVYGDVLYRLNDTTLAMDQYKIAIELDKTNSHAWYGLGLYYEALDEYPQYIEAFEKAVQYSDDTNLAIHLMDSYINTNDLLSYTDMITSLYGQFPNDYLIAKHYGQFLHLTFKKDEALDHYEMMSETFEEPDVNMLVPEYLIKLGRYQTCIEYMTANDPYNQGQNYIELYANTFSGLRKLDEALNVADEVIDQDIDDYFGYYLKGNILYNANYFLESLEYFEMAVELKNDFEIIDSLLMAYYKANRLYKFQELAYDTLDRFGDNSHIKEYLAFSYNLLGEYDEAIKIYNELLKTYPTNDDMKYYLAEAYYYSKNDKETALEYLEDYNNQYNFLDFKVTTLKNQINQSKREDVDYIGNLFYYNYVHDVDYSALDNKSGDLTDDEMNELFSDLKDPDDPFSFFIYGDSYSYVSNQQSGIEYKELSKEIHYIKIDSFTNTLGYEFTNTIDRIKNPEESTLIIDLRDNGGGSTDAANMILDNLIGPTVTFKFVYSNDYLDDYLNTSYQEFYSDASKIDFKEIYVLVNNHSASSSEIVALGLNTFLENVTIIGEQTYGKGVGQYAFEDTDKERFYFIVSFYWYIADVNIHKVGVTPEVLIENDLINDYMKDLLDLNDF